MDSILALIHDPAVQTVAFTILGVMLAKVIYPYLEGLVKKTPTLSDDEFLSRTKIIIDEALAKKTAKPKKDA